MVKPGSKSETMTEVTREDLQKIIEPNINRVAKNIDDDLGVKIVKPKVKKESVDPAQKRKWIETLAKAKSKMHSIWRKDVEEIIEFLLK